MSDGGLPRCSVLASTETSTSALGAIWLTRPFHVCEEVVRWSPDEASTLAKEISPCGRQREALEDERTSWRLPTISAFISKGEVSGDGDGQRGDPERHIERR